MLPHNSRWLILLLGALTAVGPLSMDIYLVSMPSMTDSLSASVSEVQLTLSIYMLGFGVSQIVFGPLSDRFGRRPTVIAGLALYVAASAAAALADNVTALIVARFFQAIGTCSAMIISRTVVRDLHARERAAQIFSYMQLVMSIAPLAAPIVGSHLHVAFGWQASFVLVTAYGVLAFLAVIFLLQETNRHRDPAALNPRRFASNVATLARSRIFVGYVLTIGFMGGGLFAYLSGSPFVFIRVFGFEETAFGYLFGLCMLGNIAGALISGRLVARLGIDRLLALGLALAVAAGGAMTALAVAEVDHVAIVVVPMFFFMVSFQFVLPQAMAGAMSPFPKIAGYASSMIGLMQFGVPALVGVGVAGAFDGTARPMAGAIAIMAVLAAVTFRLLVWPRRGQVAEQ